MSAMGVGILGPPAFVTWQRELLSGMSGVEAVGWWRGYEAPAEADAAGKQCRSPDELLNSGTVQAIAVGAPLPERTYWCRQVLAAGKMALAEAPLGDCARDVVDLLAASQAHRAGLSVIDFSHRGPIARGLGEMRRSIGPVLFFAMEIQMPRELLRARPEGALLTAAVGYLSLLCTVVGPIDSVWAETRSLVRLRPPEDTATAYLRAKNGTEGVVHVGALGPWHRARLQACGPDGAVEWIDQLSTAASAAWTGKYTFLVGHAGNSDDAKLVQEMVQGHRLVNWVRRAARARRELYWKEVEHD